MKKVLYATLASIPLFLSAGPGITIEIDVFFPDPRGEDYDPAAPIMCERDNDCAGGESVSCEGQKE